MTDELAARRQRQDAEPTPLADVATASADVRLLSEATMRAINHRMLMAASVLTTGLTRSLHSSDVAALTDAGWAGWQAAVLDLIADESASARVRAISIIAFQRPDKRREVRRAIEKMARGLVAAAHDVPALGGTPQP